MKKNGFFMKFVIGFTKVTAFLPTWIFFRPKIYYQNKSKQGKRLPKSCILMSNHTSLMDFPLWLLVFPSRIIRFLMAEVLFNKTPIFTWFLYYMGGIRVNRDAKDFSFVADSLQVLDQGGVVGIFPESRLPLNGVPYPFKPSVVFIALHTEAPIIPVYTAGKYGFTRRARVVVGEPIYIHEFCKEQNPSEEEINRLTKLLEEKTYALKECISEG